MESMQKQKCATFARLHESSKPFLIPNPWDVGSAKLMEGLGFSALATTSAGLAFTLGRVDGEVSLQEKIAHCRALAQATTIPINADFENGFADDPDGVARNVRQVAETGIAGCSIEDYSRDSHQLYDIAHALERVQAAAEAVASLDIPFQLTARAENLLRGKNDLEDTIKRVQHFADAGAHVLYAPGLTSLTDLRQVTGSISKPFNVLAPLFNDATVDDFAAAGATRISVGSALTWAAVGSLIRGSHEMLDKGTFNWTSTMTSAKTVNGIIAAAK